MASSEDGDARLMQCMEVWGGNGPVDAGVVMAGLDAWVRSQPQPGAASGGDVYYVSSCATGRITRMLVADVSGHGDAVAQIAVQLRRLMRRYVNHIDQSRFMAGLNLEFSRLVDTGGFATAVVATYFTPTGELLVGSAGHPPPLLYAAREGRWSLIEREDFGEEDLSNIPLGVLESSEFKQWTVPMRRGDMLLCYTDSLIEARRDGALLGTAGLLSLVRQLDASEPHRLVPSLLETLETRCTAADDDATVLLVRTNDLVPPEVRRARHWAPLRLLGALAGSLRRGGEPMPWPELSVANIGGALVPPLGRWRRGRR